jgi:hypothetical protein
LIREQAKYDKSHHHHGGEDWIFKADLREPHKF